jgi:hypothetical protein
MHLFHNRKTGLKWKTRPKQLLVSLPLAFALPGTMLQALGLTNLIIQAVPLWKKQNVPYISPENPHWRGKLSTVDLLVSNTLDQYIFILKIISTFVTKQGTLRRRSTVLSHPLQLVFPASSILWLVWQTCQGIFNNEKVSGLSHKLFYSCYLLFLELKTCWHDEI